MGSVRARRHADAYFRVAYVSQGAEGLRRVRRPTGQRPRLRSAAFRGDAPLLRVPLVWFKKTKVGFPALSGPRLQSIGGGALNEEWASGAGRQQAQASPALTTAHQTA